jgi:hypothetical protein
MTVGTLVVYAALVVGGFVFGVLFGRKNKKKVETTVEEAKEVLAKAGIKV